MVGRAARARRSTPPEEVGQAERAAPAEFVSLEQVAGLDSARKVLTAALRRNALAGTYLLKGPVGVGKTTLARAFAQAAACTSPADSPYVACGSCRSCTLMARGMHPEIVQIAPSGDQTQIWQFWDRPGKPPGALEHSLPFSPSVGARRVYIIERADTLNEAAANSLLKVLEEPPPYALFMLLTPNADRLLPTILSRCQVVTLAPMPVAALERWLTETLGVPPDRARVSAALAEGRVGTARLLATEDGIFEHVDSVMALAVRLLQARPIAALKLSEEMRRIGADLDTRPADVRDTSGETTPAEGAARTRTDRRGLGLVLDLMALTFRELLAVRLSGTASALSEQHAALAREHPELVHPSRCQRAIEVLLTARRRLEQNVPPGLLSDWITTSIVADRRGA